MEVPRFWRTQRVRYSLLGRRCDACGAYAFPPRELCQKCGSSAMKEHAFSGRGEVYSFTTMFNPPDEFSEFSPYTVGLIRLAEGPLVTAQLTDADPAQISIGMPVEMVTRKLRCDGKQGIVVYGYKFRPVLAAEE